MDNNKVKDDSIKSSFSCNVDKTSNIINNKDKSCNNSINIVKTNFIVID